MLRRIMLCVMVALTLAGSVRSAERLFLLKIGPTWPKELQWSEKPTAWDGAIQSGLIFDRKVAFGGGIDFLWNVNKKAKPISGTIYRLEKVERTFMFPVSGFFSLDPVPDLLIHPCASIQIGLNTMYYSHKEDSDLPDTTLPNVDGWYMGFYLKIAADAIFNLGEQSGIFAGFEYQWSKPQKLGVDSGDLFAERNMSGVGIRMGFRVIY